LVVAGHIADGVTREQILSVFSGTAAVGFDAQVPAQTLARWRSVLGGPSPAATDGGLDGDGQDTTTLATQLLALLPADGKAVDLDLSWFGEAHPLEGDGAERFACEEREEQGLRCTLLVDFSCESCHVAQVHRRLVEVESQGGCEVPTGKPIEQQLADEFLAL
jgi:hypothetical protein